MSRTARHSKRQQQKAKRRARRKEARKNGSGTVAGSIAINSRLPGLEGTLIGSMDVVADTRRKEQHPAQITIVVHQRAKKRAVIWTLETGFGGETPRVGFKIAPDGALDDLPPTAWFADIDSVEVIDSTDDAIDDADDADGSTLDSINPPMQLVAATNDHDQTEAAEAVQVIAEDR